MLPLLICHWCSFFSLRRGRIGSGQGIRDPHSGGGILLSLGLGFLAKGPAALLPAFFAPARALLNRAPYRVEVRSALWGVFVVLIAIGLWGVLALLATNGTYLEIGLGNCSSVRCNRWRAMEERVWQATFCFCLSI